MRKHADMFSPRLGWKEKDEGRAWEWERDKGAQKRSKNKEKQKLEKINKRAVTLLCAARAVYNLRTVVTTEQRCSFSAPPDYVSKTATPGVHLTVCRLLWYFFRTVSRLLTITTTTNHVLWSSRAEENLYKWPLLFHNCWLTDSPEPFCQLPVN